MLAFVTTTPAATNVRAAPAVDQSCALAPALPSVWASYGLDQSFSPTATRISGWEVKLLLLGQFNAPVRSRLVFNPAGEPATDLYPVSDFTPSGVVLGEVTNHIKGPAFRSFWQRFELPKPVEVLPHPAVGSYSIQIDTPIEPQFKPYGARLGWWACGGDYSGGAGHHALTPTGTGEYSRDAFGVYIEFHDEPGTHQPLVRQKHHIGDFQFRVLTG